MTAQRAITLVEIDIPYCTLSYGVAPCTAVLGVDSEVKCWNTFSTCAKREDFDEGTVTLRFAKAATYLDESGIDAIPSIIDARYEPAELSLGEPSLGVRAKLSVTLSDHPYGDTGEGFAPNGHMTRQRRAHSGANSAPGIRFSRAAPSASFAALWVKHWRKWKPGTCLSIRRTRMRMGGSQSPART